MNIESYELFSFDDYFLHEYLVDDDPVHKAIRKYENHPSIKKINEVSAARRDHFSFPQLL